MRLQTRKNIFEHLILTLLHTAAAQVTRCSCRTWPTRCFATWDIGHDELIALVDLVDEDCSGTINFDEFILMVRYCRHRKKTKRKVQAHRIKHSCLSLAHGGAVQTTGCISEVRKSSHYMLIRGTKQLLFGPNTQTVHWRVSGA
jgi:hypothetical protein